MKKCLTKESVLHRISLKYGRSERAKSLKGDDAKLRVYSRRAMIAGLPSVGLQTPLGEHAQRRFCLDIAEETRLNSNNRPDPK